ncbi:hypothetical protein AMELA_G00233320 [Ameiurus melas]|uniref:Uncharacterized protein n=1 Tax=Ameiurus melas TaxID=219545 RepID=A0A7J6A096_AMEME|nr:hypothetical protein AMELA_G00233320 [Ameiurus melas]
MHYSQTTTFEQLTMKELGKITYPQVFDQKTATHVVTAVLYGTQAFMVFDHVTDKNENKQDIEGNLHAVVKKLPNTSIDGDGSLKLSEEEKQLTENISVTFHGDFELEQNPTTYKESLEVYKKLPTLMKQRQNKGVPLNVWLYPLTLLDSKAAKLVREINVRLVDETEHLLEELSEEERRCNDLIKNQMTNDFPDLKDRLLKWKTLQNNYTRLFQKALFTLLPAIRGGAQEDKALGDILNIHYTSPFTASNMIKWLDDVTTELNILSSYTSGLKDLTVVKSSGSLSSILLEPDVDVVICLSFTSLKFEDSYLVAMQEFENLERFTTLDQTSEGDFSFQATQPWFTSPDISASMRQNISLFTNFSKANKNEKRIKFIIASISDPSNPGTSIRLYQKGVLTDPRFQPVSKPPPPVVQTSDEKVLLKLSKSPTGETVRFRVEYRMTPPTDSEDDIDGWTVTDTSDAQTSFTLTGLKPADQYWVRYRAVSDVGVSEASHSVPFSTDLKLSIKVGQSWVDDDIAFHFNPRISDTVVQNNRRDGRWENEEHTSGCPISKGSAFDVFIVTKSEGYEVYVNGQWCCLFKHRMAMEKVASLYIADDVMMNIVGIVQNWNTSTFGKELNSGTSRTKRSDIQSDVPHPVCSPTGPSYLYDIALHFNPRLNSNCVIRNSETPGGPFVKGGAFDIIIVVKPEGYEV